VSTNNFNLASDNGTGPRFLMPESTYDHNHPEVVEATRKFSTQAAELNIFANIDAAIAQRRSKAAAAAMGHIWLGFSLHVPRFITGAVAQTSDPERQHHLIQIAVDELGGQDKERIHSTLFKNAVADIGIPLFPEEFMSARLEIVAMLDGLLDRANSDEAINGVLMSLEIPAERNIETLFDCLVFDEASRQSLSAAPFFTIHRQDETEHIRHSVANFLRFCNKTDAQRQAFLASFADGLSFWVRFWDLCARSINVATAPARAPAPTFNTGSST
jgi:Iron-containing redox enzyme